MPTIILDTDFLVKVANDPLPGFDFNDLTMGYRLATIPSVVKELEGLTRRKGTKTSTRASNALKVLKEGYEGIQIIAETKSKQSFAEADIDLVELAVGHRDDYVIATLDHSLLSKLERLRIPYLTLRNNRPLFKGMHMSR